MSLKKKLHENMVTAMKTGRRLQLTTIRSIIGEINTREKGGKTPIELDDAAIIRLMQKEAAKRRESATIYADAGSADRASAESQEAEIIEAYLPEALTETQVQGFIEAAVVAVIPIGEPLTMRHMGAIMKLVTADVAGRYEGKQVSNLVKERLAR